MEGWCNNMSKNITTTVPFDIGKFDKNRFRSLDFTKYDSILYLKCREVIDHYSLAKSFFKCGEALLSLDTYISLYMFRHCVELLVKDCLSQYKSKKDRIFREHDLVKLYESLLECIKKDGGIYLGYEDSILSVLRSLSEVEDNENAYRYPDARKVMSRYLIDIDAMKSFTSDFFVYCEFYRMTCGGHVDKHKKRIMKESSQLGAYLSRLEEVLIKHDN